MLRFPFFFLEMFFSFLKHESTTDTRGHAAVPFHPLAWRDDDPYQQYEPQRVPTPSEAATVGHMQNKSMRCSETQLCDTS